MFRPSDLLDEEPLDEEKVFSCTSNTNKKNIEECTQIMERQGIDLKNDFSFLDADCSEEYRNFKEKISPTITRSRGSTGGFYMPTKERKMTVDELLRWQGFRPKTVKWKKAGLSKSGIGTRTDK